MSRMEDDYHELIERYNSLRAEREWVSVKDRLPEDDGEYLCLLDFGTVDQVAVSTFRVGGHWIRKGVTHWMRLPEPPK